VSNKGKGLNLFLSCGGGGGDSRFVHGLMPSGELHPPSGLRRDRTKGENPDDREINNSIKRQKEIHCSLKALVMNMAPGKMDEKTVKGGAQEGGNRS